MGLTAALEPTRVPLTSWLAGIVSPDQREAAMTELETHDSGLNLDELHRVAGGWQKYFEVKVGGMILSGGITDNGKHYGLASYKDKIVATVK